LNRTNEFDQAPPGGLEEPEVNLLYNDDDIHEMEHASYAPQERPAEYGPEDLEDNNNGNVTFGNFEVILWV
jgi:hypothetical protein